eukprot:g33602.t1
MVYDLRCVPQLTFQHGSVRTANMTELQGGPSNSASLSDACGFPTHVLGRRLSQCTIKSGEPELGLPGAKGNWKRTPGFPCRWGVSSEFRGILSEICSTATVLQAHQGVQCRNPGMVRKLRARCPGTGSSEVKKHLSVKSPSEEPAFNLPVKKAAASVSSMSMDMFSLSSKHNAQLLSKKKSFSVANITVEQPRKAALKRYGSCIEQKERRLSQASVKIIAPESAENSLSLPGALGEGLEKSDSEKSVDSILAEAPSEQKSEEWRRDVSGSVPGAPSPYASIAGSLAGDRKGWV